MDLKDIAGKSANAVEIARLRFCNVAPGPSVAPSGAATKIHDSLGWDGLPLVGSWVEPGDPLYCVVNPLTGKITVGKVRRAGLLPFLGV